MKKITILLIGASALFASCQKELTGDTPGPKPESVNQVPDVPKCSYVGYLNEGGLRDAQRMGTRAEGKNENFQLLMKNGKIAGTLCSRKTVSQPLTNVVLYIDFNENGDSLASSIWGTFYCASPHLSQPAKDSILRSVTEDYSRWNVEVTTDVNRFNQMPFNKRVRCLLTQGLNSIFDPSGGISFVGQMDWGYENLPCFVFCDNLRHAARYIREAVAHEFGHAAGALFHQSIYDGNCVLNIEYNPGLASGALGAAPIMGNSYSQTIDTWWIGKTPQTCSGDQNDTAQLSQRFGLKSISSDGTISSGETKTGIITPSTTTTYKVNVKAGKTTVTLASGGNTKIKITVFDSKGVPVGILDSPDGIGIAQTIISTKSGTYYLKVMVSTLNLPVGTPDNQPVYGGEYSITVKN